MKDKEISKKEPYEKPELKKEGLLRDITASDTGMTQIDPPSLVQTRRHIRDVHK